MEWYKRYTNRSNHGQLYAAGFWGGIVFDALCDSSAAYDLNGRLPPVYVSPDYLQRQLRLSESDFCGASRNVTTYEKGSVTHEKHVVTVLSEALKSVISAGLVRQEGEFYIIDGWERKQRKAPKSDAERAREYRENKKLKKESVESESVTNRHVRDRDANVRVTERHDQSRVEESREEKKREEKKEDVADATGKRQGSKAVDEIPPGRLKALTDSLVASWQRLRNSKYLHAGGKDAKSLKELARNNTDAEIVARWERGIVLGKYPAPSNFAQLLANWNALDGRQGISGQVKAPKPKPISTAEALEKSLKEAKPLLPLKERNPKLWAENEARLAAQREEEKKRQEEWARYDMEANLKRQGGNNGY